MMNRSAGVPNRAAGSLSSAGGTWPCGQISGRSPTEAYSARATVRWAGSALKQQSGESARGELRIIPLLLLVVKKCSDGLWTLSDDGIVSKPRWILANSVWIKASCLGAGSNVACLAWARALAVALV